MFGGLAFHFRKKRDNFGGSSSFWDTGLVLFCPPPLFPFLVGGGWGEGLVYWSDTKLVFNEFRS